MLGSFTVPDSSLPAPKFWIFSHASFTFVSPSVADEPLRKWPSLVISLRSCVSLSCRRWKKEENKKLEIFYFYFKVWFDNGFNIIISGIYLEKWLVEVGIIITHLCVARSGREEGGRLRLGLGMGA